MPVPQPGAVLNVLLLVLCGTGGWFLAAWTKKAPHNDVSISSESAGAPPHQPGAFTADARFILAKQSAGAREFDELTSRYGSGSAALELLAEPVLEKWVAGDPAGAAAEALPRCLSHTPDLLPRLISFLGAAPGSSPPALVAAIPAGPVREPCLAALAIAYGNAARADALAFPATLTRGERTLFLREWHRSRAVADREAAEKSAATLTDPDDRESAVIGILLGRAETDPEAALRESITRDDYALVANAAFRHWLARDPAAAWNFASGHKPGPRLATLCAAIAGVECRRRHATDVLPEIQSLLSKHFPGGPPEEVLAVVIPALAAEGTQTVQKFIDSLPGSGPGQPPSPASVMLFDVFCDTDPAAAWRLAESLSQRPGSKDGRATHRWKTALAREHAAPAERLAAGFPDFTDMTALVLRWLESDPPAALTTFCAPNVQLAMQRLAVETALHPLGAAIPLSELRAWSQLQSPSLDHTIEALTSK